MTATWLPYVPTAALSCSSASGLRLCARVRPHVLGDGRVQNRSGRNGRRRAFEELASRRVVAPRRRGNAGAKAAERLAGHLQYSSTTRNGAPTTVEVETQPQLL